MAWNPERYEEWFNTPEGSFALEQEARLLQNVLAGWPRRKRKLLEIGCGTGAVPGNSLPDGPGRDGHRQFAGDDHGRAETVRGNRAELHLGHGEHMGFSDNEFDYAFIWSVLEFTEDPEALLAEAARVAGKGDCSSAS